MTSNPVISIIVPVYGVESYIEQCACSIFEQTYPEIEIIFVNDGTPDRSIIILKELIANKYRNIESRIKIIDQENQGAPSARKRGLAEANGDYIFFIDSDDWIEPDAAEQIAYCAKQSNADLIYFGFFKEKKNKTVIRYDKNWQQAGRMEFIKALYTRKTYGYNVIKCFKREIYLNKSIIFPKKGMLDDICLVSQLLFYSHSMYRLEKPLYHYRRTNPHSITRQKREKKRLDSSINMMDLYLHYRGSLTESPVQDVYRHILYYTAWNAIYFKLPLFKMYPTLEEDLKAIPISRKNLLPFFKQTAVRIYLTFKGLGQRP